MILHLFYYLFLILVAILIGFFANLNPTIVTINYVVGQLAAPISVLIVSSFITGFLLAILFLSLPLIITRYKNRSLKRKLDKVNEQLIEN